MATTMTATAAPARDLDVLAPLDESRQGRVSLVEVGRLAFESLFANKVRALLTMLGVIIGVASVVALLAIGNGASASITSQIQSNGTNLLTIRPGSPNQRGPGEQNQAQNLTMTDVVAIARALVGSPAVILADEPTGALDTKTSAEILGILQRLNREQGLTVVLVTHEADIAAYAQRVLTMRDGVLVSDTPPRAQAA